LALPVLLVAALLTVACLPATYPTNEVTFEGDSLMIQAGMWSGDDRFATGQNGDIPAHPGHHMSAGMGWKTAQARSDATADVRHLPRVLVIALGHNDAGDGWTWADRDAYSANVRSVPAEACVVAVLPGVGSSATAAHRQRITSARASLQAIARENPGTVVVDMQVTIDRNQAAGTPIVGSDGVHLADPPGPLTTAYSGSEYIDTLYAGLDQCGGAL
jgi:hypothetical protein